MKQLLSFATVAGVALLLGACGASAPADTGNQVAAPPSATVAEDGSLQGNLNIMSFVPDPFALGVYFDYLNPGVTTNITVTPIEGGAFQQQLQQILATGSNVPDLIMLDAQFVRQFVETPFLSDIDFMLSHVAGLDIYPFTLDAGTYNGQLRAISHQATPGVMYVRRSMARTYFGTDDPTELQAYFQDLDTFIASARRIHQLSGGNTFALPAFGELAHMMWANRDSPWIVDNTLVIDPMVETYFDIARILRDEGLEAQVGTWSGEWFSGMSDTLANAAGEPINIFAYFLPTWGLHGTLMHNATTSTTDTTGDWLLIPGPMPYYWGGAWWAIPRDAQNPALAREFLEWFFTEEVQTQWMVGYLTNDRLREMDPTVGAEIHINAGDFMSSDLVNRTNADAIVGTAAYHFVGGLNPHSIFALASPELDLSIIQGTDFIIQDALGSALEQYVNNLVTREQAMDMFKDSILMDLPNLVVNR